VFFRKKGEEKKRRGGTLPPRGRKGKKAGKGEKMGVVPPIDQRGKGTNLLLDLKGAKKKGNKQTL